KVILNRTLSKSMKACTEIFQETVSLIEQYFWLRNIPPLSKEDFENKLNCVNDVYFLFTEILKYRSVLKLCVTKLYNICSLTLLPSLKSQFVFLFYVSLFGMEIFGENGLKHFLLCNKVHYSKELLRFLCTYNVISEIKSEWVRVYDETFVNEFLIKPLEKWRPIFSALQEYLESDKNTFHPRKVTEIQPFKLTVPKPRSVLIPEIVIPEMQKMRNPPPSTYNQPPEISLLETEKFKNRQKIENLKIQSNKLQPRCSGVTCSDAKVMKNQNQCNLEKISTVSLEDISKSRKKINFPISLESHRTNSYKRNNLSVLNKTAVVNTNAVTILREWKLYSDREKEQRQKLFQLESGAFTDVAFNAWKEEEEMKMKINQLKQVERNRLNVMISHEASLAAKFNLSSKRQIEANELKVEKRAKLMELLNEKKLEQERMNKIAKVIASSHENAKIAKKEVMKKKRKLASEILKESKQLLHEAEIKAQEENKIKRELIAKIQAEESSAIMTKPHNVKQIDLCNTPGHGLLNEMSIIELRERLIQLKINKQCELNKKRDEIISDKEQKTKILSELLNRIGKHRSVKTMAKVKKMYDNLDKEDIYKNDPSLQEMLNYLNKQKAERQNNIKNDQSRIFRKYVNKGVKNKGNQFTRTFWDELERQREKRSCIETGSTHHPSQHLITSLTA
ncbi:Cilia- and flagella-associated protein isoform 3, partial [Schistosoma japonicum]